MKRINNQSRCSSVLKVCFSACGGVLHQIRSVRDRIFRQFNQSDREHSLHLALNEAEALAWQTDYPHLVFPELAAEKANAVLAWEAKQAKVRRFNPTILLAA